MSDLDLAAQCAADTAPLCFGAITFYAMDSERCGACAFSNGCSDAVEKHIAKVSHVIDVDSLLKRHMALKQGKKKPEKTAPDSGELETQDPEVKLKARTEVVLKRMLGCFGTKKGRIGKFQAAMSERTNKMEPGSVDFIAVELLFAGPLSKDALAVAIAETAPDARLESEAIFAALVGLQIAAVIDDDTIQIK